MAGALIALTALAGSASQAVADVPCTTRSTNQPFLSWSDSNSYFVAPSGRFESGLGDWVATGGASVVSGNSPFFINGSADSHSVALPPGSSITLNRMCVSKNEDRLRMFGRSDWYGSVDVSATVTNGSSTTTSAGKISIAYGSGWKPTGVYMFPDVYDANAQEYVTITLKNNSLASTYYIDDIMVDPWRSN